MASIQKIQRTKGAVYKVTIRQTGNGTICKTFPLKKQAVEFARTVEGDNKPVFRHPYFMNNKIHMEDLMIQE